MTQPQKTFEGFDAPVDNRAKLQEKFIVPPFSILDTRQGYWQDRKRLWLSLGIKSELGREAVSYQSQDSLNAIMKQRANPNATKGTLIIDTYRGKAEQGHNVAETGTSIFDPVLCELIYKWFCPEEGTILDPFAGGSVRGIIASVLGYSYIGIDLSAEQIEANRIQAQGLTPEKQPEWVIGNSCKLETLLPQGKQYDLVFTCPPYHDLEQYTDEMEDLSNMSWDTFKRDYNNIIAQAILRLKNNRFACIVVSEIRNDLGSYKGLVPYTIDCFNRNGARYYNELILVNSVGSLPVRISHQFNASRKIGRTHQNILVFYKGDVDLIPNHFKGIDSTMPYFLDKE